MPHFDDSGVFFGEKLLHIHNQKFPMHYTETPVITLAVSMQIIMMKFLHHEDFFTVGFHKAELCTHKVFHIAVVDFAGQLVEHKP